MGLIDYLKTQFLEIIQWEDDSRDTISFRYPDLDKEIKRGANLLGVGENDVLAALGEGSLKGTKIGAAWRITRAAREELLKT